MIDLNQFMRRVQADKLYVKKEELEELLKDNATLIIYRDIVLPITSLELAIGYTNSIEVEFTNRQPVPNEQARCFATTTDGVVYSLLLTFTGSIVENELSQQFYPFSVTELLVVNKNFDHTKYVTLDTPQTIIGEKYFKIGNAEGLENLVMYANDSFMRKPLHIRVGESNTDNIDCENDYTNFWKMTTFLGQTKIDINDSGTPNLLATHDNTAFHKRAIFIGPLDANGLLFAGGGELRFGGDFLNITDNTDGHNVIVHVHKDFINFERVATFKRGANVDVQPTEPQHAVRKDYVDNAIANAITKVLTTEV